ncbi:MULTISPECIES: DUF1214 domain-containing protein [unclassified Ensifer]|uniref:DUF1214 domain-containing protein n=1 Tax=unclassified Ensifer TaxID=2633371 RepID=UPI000813B75D|nr:MULTISPECIES: DUF1214 domain-containing protein [unclassified Ensifer]OCP24484.1 hypothetical protein BC361_20030 [Ensifer sp. LC54]OCP26116.1 hypothetical protein BC363_18505 [Ensifer sp. LC384]OCP36803.1 hypothetical protein BC360_05495 [Ensifer sp. LC163]
MFRIPLLVALTLAIAFGGGIASAVWALKATVGFGSISIGPWVAFPEAQTENADPYAKAHRARAGELLYGGAEGLTFTAQTDDKGEKLSAACSYDVSGLTPQARFWTLYAANADGLPLRPGSDLPSAINSWTVLRAEDSSFTIHASPIAKPDNWLALRHSGTFRLVLTLLDTPTAGSSGLIDLAMPKVVKTGCGDA